MGRVTPLTMAAPSLRRKRMQLVTSSTSANLPRGILASMGPAWRNHVDISQRERDLRTLAGSDQPTFAMAVMVTVGLTALTLICLGPSSRAVTLGQELDSNYEGVVLSYFVIMSRAPFVAQYTVWSARAAWEA